MEVVINLCVNANIMENAQPYIFSLCVNTNMTKKVQPTCFLLCANANIIENSFSTSIPVENLAEA